MAKTTEGAAAAVPLPPGRRRLRRRRPAAGAAAAAAAAAAALLGAAEALQAVPPPLRGRGWACGARAWRGRTPGSRGNIGGIGSIGAGVVLGAVLDPEEEEAEGGGGAAAEAAGAADATATEPEPEPGTEPASPSALPAARRSSGRLTPDDVAHLKATVPLTSVVEAHNLPQFRRTSPTRAICLCPFHDDSNPSLNIDDERGLYKCFACGAGGDVYNFVREYRYVSDGGRKMGFLDAVRLVSDEYGDGSVPVPGAGGGGGSGSGLGPGGGGEGSAPPLTEEGRIRARRIGLANAAAADHYGRCLASLPEAGAARAHLRGRGVRPGAVRTYALGYAPDAYFFRRGGGGGEGMTRRRRRGQGSLVERLLGLGFTGDEIVDAGLATRPKGWEPPRGKNRTLVEEEGGGGPDGAEVREDEEDEEEEDGSNLMDRFRGRLMVPIFDSDCRTVLGFGGRHIDPEPSSSSAATAEKGKSSSSSSSSYKAAKYLNSPESPIFRKKEVLFGSSAAKRSLDERRAEIARTTLGSAPLAMERPGGRDSPDPPTLLVVEGYFDAIALASAGVGGAVSCMGTALTAEQLREAARIAGSPGGRVVLCLDGDAAGQAATERLCEARLLDRLEGEGDGEEEGDGRGRGDVDVLVASLPPDVNDPADFVQEYGGEAFQERVVGTARPWRAWYVDRMVSQYDRGNSTVDGAGMDQPFLDVCDRVATFLATFPVAAEREATARGAAAALAEALDGPPDPASEGGEEGSSPAAANSSSLRIRLEADLLDLAARKANVRDAMSKRLGSADGERSMVVAGNMAKMASGEGVTSIINDYDILPARDFIGESKGADANRSMPQDGEYREQNRGNKRQQWKKKTPYRAAPPLTPHFSGFEFVNPTDAAWLDIKPKKTGSKRQNPAALIAGGGKDAEQRLMKEAIETGEQYVPLDDKLVYFNSNTYHGNKFLTNEARLAGYGEEGRSYDGSMIGLGVPALVEQDADRILLDAEERLLRALAQFPSARSAMKGAIRTNLQSQMGTGPALIEWSDPDREWLFGCLTNAPGRAPLPSELEEIGNVAQLGEYLAGLPDVPSGAFDPQRDSALGGDDDGGASAEEEGPSGEGARPLNGSLEAFFVPEENLKVTSLTDEISIETRAELTVQETLAGILRATALKRMEVLKGRWISAATALERRTDATASAAVPDGQGPGADPRYEDMDLAELEALSGSLGKRFSEALQTVQELSESAKRIGSRLLDYCSTEGVEYRLSSAKQERLYEMMDEHVGGLPEDLRPDRPGDEGGYVFGSDEYDDMVDPTFGGRPVPDPSQYQMQDIFVPRNNDGKKGGAEEEEGEEEKKKKEKKKAP